MRIGINIPGDFLQAIHAGCERSVRVQLQPAVTGWYKVYCKVFAAWQELDAGRRRGEQLYAIACLLKQLVYMTP